MPPTPSTKSDVNLKTGQIVTIYCLRLYTVNFYSMTQICVERKRFQVFALRYVVWFMYIGKSTKIDCISHSTFYFHNFT
jgi:hypothetical protein